MLYTGKLKIIEHVFIKISILFFDLKPGWVLICCFLSLQHTNLNK